MFEIGLPGAHDQIRFYKFTSLEDAEKEMDSHAHTVKGVFFVSTDLQRGFDMRLGKDSLIICFDSKANPLS